MGLAVRGSSWQQRSAAQRKAKGKQAPRARQGRSDELAPSRIASPAAPNGGSKWLWQTRAPAEAHAHHGRLLWMDGSCFQGQGSRSWPAWLMLWHLVQPIPKAVTDGR